MSYEAKLPPPTRDDVRNFVVQHFDEEERRLEAAAALNALLERIASAPREMGAEEPGPMPGRTCVRQVPVGEHKYPVRVNYEIDDANERVIVNGLGFQAF